MSRSAARLTNGQNIIVCLSPDVCMTPIGSAIVPVPYMIMAKLDWSTRTESKITFGGEEAFTMASRTTKVTGNEAGAAGGVASSVNVGWCRPQSNKSNFFVAGHQVLQDDCLFEMNCAGPDGGSNTLGKLVYRDG